ncbi:unnamed protein product [Eruca vesicaria subsp. sativa]|uniref:Uncharacterized protein n=1 Tax=Eruca vesicaria subsp. sativa TaxID=29727 RepID=A0ABC8J2I6_ERUVS|nr:unnamed protein product [Eruca vesicaria subsp. sativa]
MTMLHLKLGQPILQQCKPTTMFPHPLMVHETPMLHEPLLSQSLLGKGGQGGSPFLWDV